MSWNESIALLVVTLIFLCGILCTLLPLIPGTLIVWSGILLHKLWLGAFSVDWKFVLFIGLVALLGQIADLFFTLWGARRFGATWKGTLGALVGFIVGIFLPPPLLWLFLGPMIGTLIGELLSGRGLKAGSLAGTGTLIGNIISFAFNFALSLFMVLGFYLLLYFHPVF